MASESQEGAFHPTAVWFLSQEADEAVLLSLYENLDVNSSIL